MNGSFDEQYTKNHSTVAAIDEVGRGPWAGPVFSCCCFLPKEKEAALVSEIPFLNDSKKMAPRQREAIARWVVQHNIPFSLGTASEEEIDCENILRATAKSMTRAIKRLPIAFDLALVDGTNLPLAFPNLQLPHGDSLSIRIALASNIAKFFRDQYMRNLDEVYPTYGFAQHKGYGTQLHLRSIQRFGVLPVHRLTFSPVNDRVEIAQLILWQKQGRISEQRWVKILEKKGVGRI